MVRDLIDTTRRMKEQLGPTLIKETQIKMVTMAEIIIETREVMSDEVTELAETREIEGELDGVKDEHTHTHRGSEA